MNASDPAGIPLIDMADAESDPVAFAARLGQAWHETGFVGVTGHGIPESVIADCRAAARAFFDLPTDVKQRYHITGGGGQRGYTPFRIETAKGASLPDLKEFWHVGRTFPDGDTRAAQMPANVWPEDVPGFRTACNAFFAAMDDLGCRLLQAVARHLELEPDYFETRVRAGNSILRLLNYPPLDGTTAGERAGAHEDINVITLLVGADQAGLEILHRRGQWVPVNPAPGTIVCNVGDMLQRLTNGRLPSTTHRVVCPAGPDARRARISMPFFLHFQPEVVIEALPSCTGPGLPDPLPPITADAFLAQRLREIGLT